MVFLKPNFDLVGAKSGQHSGSSPMFFRCQLTLFSFLFFFFWEKLWETLRGIFARILEDQNHIFLKDLSIQRLEVLFIRLSET